MPERKTILLIEDDALLREAAALTLSSAGFRVLETDGIVSGFHLFQKEKPDLVILDVGLPDGSGVDLCRKMRAHKNLAATPVIMLTAKGDLGDKESGFDAGVDQYLVKPVVPRELLLWSQALLKRLQYDQGGTGQLEVGELVIDPAAHLVRFRDATISNLTGKEFDLLYFLVRSRPKVLTRPYILTNLWHTVAVDRLIDTHIGNLRRKLPPDLADKLQTVPGKGFRYFG